MLSNRKEIHVEWGDCDPAGIVYYPRFFEYFDACTNALFEKAGFRKAQMLKTYGLLGIPIVAASAQFFAAASFGDTVAVETRIVDTVSTQDLIQDILEAAQTGNFGTVVVGRESLHGFRALFTSHVGDALIRQAHGLTVWVVE